MKKSRRERKIFNEGKEIGYLRGYAEGYAKGLHDGNPLIAVAEACADIVKTMSDQLSDPEFIAYLKEMQENEGTIPGCSDMIDDEIDEHIEIEGGDL